MMEHSLERYLDTAKLYEIGGETNKIQRLNIACNILKE
jgi:alkylation response protein AidB-like acyl-CoA dehydrogenase